MQDIIAYNDEKIYNEVTEFDGSESTSRTCVRVSIQNGKTHLLLNRELTIGRLAMISLLNG